MLESEGTIVTRRMMLIMLALSGSNVSTNLLHASVSKNDSTSRKGQRTYNDPTTNSRKSTIFCLRGAWRFQHNLIGKNSVAKSVRMLQMA